VRVQSLTLSYTLGVPDVTLGLPFGPHPCNPFALVASPKLGLQHRMERDITRIIFIKKIMMGFQKIQDKFFLIYGIK
jgi:hypothetical protein